MAEKENVIKSRIQLKNDTEQNWAKATGFIPKKGEPIIYNVDDQHDHPRLKIGNGTDNVATLPFIEQIMTPITNEEIDALFTEN